MGVTGMFKNSYKSYPPETAARKLAAEQHAPGVTCRMNPQTFRVEYIRPDGTIVPDYQYFLRLAMEGQI